MNSIVLQWTDLDICHTMWYLCCCNCLILFSAIFSGYIHVLYVTKFVCLKVKYMYQIFYIKSSFEGHLAQIYTLTVAQNATMNIRHTDFKGFGCLSRNGNAGSYGRSIFRLVFIFKELLYCLSFSLDGGRPNLCPHQWCVTASVYYNMGKGNR